MNIGVIDADLLGKTKHRFPNLACMKISGYYKNLGHNVTLITDYIHLFKDNHDKIKKKLEKGTQIYDIYDELKTYIESLKQKQVNTNATFDKVYICKVFTDTPVPLLVLLEESVTYGGTGFFFDKSPQLPYEIEHHMPDYHLYDNWVESMINQGWKRKEFEYYLNFSIGFTTKGCFRGCEFCVNRNCKRVKLHSPLEEFYDPTRKYICLLDDNVLGYGKWKEIVNQLKATKKPFQFKQGLDIRLLTDKRAEILSEVKYKGDYIFAFDDVEDKEEIIKKIDIWKKYVDTTKKNTKLYVLVAFKSQDINDIIEAFERIKILMSKKCLPYIMRFKDYKGSKFEGIYVQLARWCNQVSLFKKKSLREFVELDGKGKEGKLYASKRYLLEFEKEYPEIAAKYFDLKYSDC